MRTKLVIRLYTQSVGNWSYPFILLAWRISQLLVPRKKVKINQLSFTLSCTNWITHFRWYTFKNKEPETIYFIDNFLNNGDVFFDIGANIGVFSIYAGKKYKDTQIISFEPEVSNLAILKENIIENKLTKQIMCYNLAISDEVGLSKLHLQDFTPGAALHTEDIGEIEFSAEGNRPIVWAEGIYRINLDYFCKETNIFPSVIKIDTDGNEDKILMGAKTILNNPNLRSIIMEMPENGSSVCESILFDSNFKKISYDKTNSRNIIWIRK